MVVSCATDSRRRDGNAGPRFCWFRRIGWLQVLRHIAGWVVLILAFALFANVFWAIDRQSHWVSDTFYGVFPYFAAVFLSYEWIGARSSGDARQ